MTRGPQLHPLVRFLHPEMSKAIVDIESQPRWLCRAVKERDGELHQDEGEQRQAGYDVRRFLFSHSVFDFAHTYSEASRVRMSGS